MFKPFVSFLLLLTLIPLAQIKPFNLENKLENNPSIIFVLDADTSLNNLTQAITDVISHNLKNEGYGAVFVPPANYPSRYNLSFNLDIETSANVYLEVSQFVVARFLAVPYTSPIANISPLLETSYLTGSEVAFKESRNKQSIENSANLATALALYSIGDCAGMETYFEPIFTSLTTAYSSEQKNLLKSLYFYQGNCNLLANDYSQAQTNFESALIIDGSDSLESGLLVGSAVNLAWTYIQIEKPQSAIDLMTRMFNDVDRYGEGYMSQPMWINRYVQRAEIYNLVGQYSDAITDLNFAVNISLLGSYLQSRIQMKRGQTYLLLYEWDNVLADYNKAIELDPTYADAYFFRGVLYYSILQTGQAMYTDALADFQRYLDLAPNGAHAAEALRYLTDIQTQQNALNN